MKALVTGGSGFIGSHLMDKLKSLQLEVVNYDKEDCFSHDIRDLGSLHGIVKAFQPDIIFHLAGLLGTSELMECVREAEEINVIGTLNVLDICKEFNVPLVFASKINPSDWINPYTITKRTCDAYCKMYEKQWNLKICLLKPLNIYGPRQKAYPVQKYVPTFIQKALKNKPLPVWGTGNQKVDPVYIEDVVAAMIRAWEKQCWGKTIQVGLGKGWSVMQVAEMILELTQSKSKIELLPMRPGEPVKHGFPVIADTRMMEKSLNMHPEKMVQLVDGLVKTISWWSKQ